MENVGYFEQKQNEYKEGFILIKKEMKNVLENLELGYTINQILGFDSLTIKDIQLKKFNETEKAKNDFSVLSSESYYDNGKHLRTRSTIYVKKLTKTSKMGPENFYQDFVIYYKLVALFNRYKFLILELETFISLNFFENEAIKLTNYLFEDIKDEFLLPMANNEEEYRNLVKILNKEQDFVKQMKAERAEEILKKKEK